MLISPIHTWKSVPFQFKPKEFRNVQHIFRGQNFAAQIIRNPFDTLSLSLIKVIMLMRLHTGAMSFRPRVIFAKSQIMLLRVAV